MDPCLHPTLTHTVGFLSGHGKGPGPSEEVYPVMSMCKTSLHSDVLGVSHEGWTEDVGDDPVWEKKTDEKMLWRGRTTGIYYQDGVPWSEPFTTFGWPQLTELQTSPNAPAWSSTLPAFQATCTFSLSPAHIKFWARRNSARWPN
jgi:hypothetical protein